MLGAELVTVGVEHFGFALEGKDQCPPHRNHAQRLVRRIENQRSSQGDKSL